MSRVRTNRPTLGTQKTETEATATRKVSPSTLSVTFLNRGDKIVEEHIALYQGLEDAAGAAEVKVKPFGTAAIFTGIEFGLLGPMAEIRFLREERDEAEAIANSDPQDLMVERNASEEAATAYVAEMAAYVDVVNESLVSAVEELQAAAAAIQV